MNFGEIVKVNCSEIICRSSGTRIPRLYEFVAMDNSSITVIGLITELNYVDGEIYITVKIIGYLEQNQFYNGIKYFPQMLTNVRFLELNEYAVLFNYGTLTLGTLQTHEQGSEKINVKVNAVDILENTKTLILASPCSKPGLKEHFLKQVFSLNSKPVIYINLIGHSTFLPHINDLQTLISSIMLPAELIAKILLGESSDSPEFYFLHELITKVRDIDSLITHLEKAVEDQIYRFERMALSQINFYHLSRKVKNNYEKYKNWLKNHDVRYFNKEYFEKIIRKSRVFYGQELICFTNSSELSDGKILFSGQLINFLITNVMQILEKEPLVIIEGVELVDEGIELLMSMNPHLCLIERHLVGLESYIYQFDNIISTRNKNNLDLKILDNLLGLDSYAKDIISNLSDSDIYLYLRNREFPIVTTLDKEGRD